MAVATALTACGDGSTGDHWSGTVDTLDNGMVLVSNPAEGLWTDETGWRLVEELRIGSVEGEGPAVFGEINDVEVDGLGRLYVLDRQAQDIRVFDASGAYVRTIGREGEGPGEFRTAHGLEFAPDGRLWVADSRLRRFSVFDTSGAFVTSYPRRILRWGYWWDGGFVRSGALYDYTGAGPPGDVRSALTTFDTTGVAADTVILPVYEAAFVRFAYMDGATVTFIPFKEAQHWTLDRRGSLWLGISDRYRIYEVSLDGDTLRAFERQATPVAVTAAERDSAMSRLRTLARGGPVDVTIPDHKPFFVTFDVDDRGYLWVRPTPADDDSGVPFDVFDPEGRFLGTVVADLRIAPFSPVWVRGDRMYATHRDELDVPYVVRLRIEGR